MFKDNKLGQKFFSKRDTYIYYFTIAIVIAAAAYAIVPMVILWENYIFPIHDGLDSYAGLVQMIHDKGLYLHLNKSLPILNNIPGKYSFISYNLYDFLNCIFGYLTGQILTRIIGVLLGFFSMRLLLKRLFTAHCLIDYCIISLISIVYAITPCASNRTIGFASLPLIVTLFLYLEKEEKFSAYSLASLLYPFFSIFDTMLVFVIGFWIVGIIIGKLSRKKYNINLVWAFAFMCVSTILVNINFVLVALNANETNRSLRMPSDIGMKWLQFRTYLLKGLYHAPALHGYIFLPFIILGTLYVFFRHRKYVDDTQKVFFRIKILGGGWIFWLFSALILTYQEAGYSVGILIIDGFQWGRIIEIMRFIWCLMVGAIVFSPPDDCHYIKNNFSLVSGLIIFFLVMLTLSIFFHDVGYPAGITLFDGLWEKNALDFFRILGCMGFVIIAFSVNLKKLFKGIIYGIIVLQLFFVAFAITNYNDVAYTIAPRILDYDGDSTICMREFFSKNLFTDIKRDINYQDEKVAAFGYHPSVLIYNGFTTLDGYNSVHPMEYQIQFRKIIEPALEKYPNFAEYYDGWGGRMYLFGDLPYTPTRDKNVAPVPLYINTAAFKDLGGKYILSRAPILNAEELKLDFVKDYDREDSIYHIYLYSADIRENIP